jgi:uncharacterized protein YbaP (TraB family)
MHPLRAPLVLILVALLVLAGVGGLVWHGVGPRDRPALWRISAGDRHGWLFGTIHAAPAGARWLTPTIAQAIGESDVLILEVAGLDAERRDRAVFERLGRSPGLPPLSQRLAQAEHARLRALAVDLTEPLDPYEDWAAALLIAAAANEQARARARDAGEAVLEAAFRQAGKPMRGLESIETQLARFDTLRTAEQHALLVQTINESTDAPARFSALYRAWAAGDLAALQDQVLAPSANRTRLWQALVDAPNGRWAEEIDGMMRRADEVPFIAVGAGHLVGPDNLRARLAARGWSVERVQ